VTLAYAQVGNSPGTVLLMICNRSMERRRRVRRVNTTAWFGRYFVEDDPQSVSKECRVIDISLLGLGLELISDMTEDMIGHRLVIHVGALAGESVSLRMVGQAKSMRASRLGCTRAGLEFFTDLSETEREILKAIELLKRLGWVPSSDCSNQKVASHHRTGWRADGR
jgi:hypothetical protein